MKTKLGIIAILLGLSGCTMFSSRQYDPVEYSYAVSIAADATHAVSRCDKRGPEYDAYLQKINSTTFLLDEFVANKSDSEQALPAALQIREVTKGLLANKSYSTRYCQHKLSNVQASARMFARGVGNTDRFNVCLGKVEERFASFEDSFKNNKITNLEFVDLGGDLMRLKTIDTSSCTLQQRVEFEKAIATVKTALSLIPSL